MAQPQQLNAVIRQSGQPAEWQLAAVRAVQAMTAGELGYIIEAAPEQQLELLHAAVQGTFPGVAAGSLASPILAHFAPCHVTCLPACLPACL